MQCKEQWPKPGFDMPEVILLVPQPLQIQTEQPSHWMLPTACSQLLGVWGAGRRVKLEHPCLPNLLSHKGEHACTLYILWEECMCFFGWRGTKTSGVTYRKVFRNFCLYIYFFCYSSVVLILHILSVNYMSLINQ